MFLKKEGIAHHLNKSIAVIEDFSFDTNKTKNYKSFLKAIDAEKTKTLLVIAAPDKNISLSGRNLPNTKVITASQINTYDVLHADRLLLLESAIGKISTVLNK